MDYFLQVHQAKYIFPIPDGLKELSSDIIREVLRHQPKHINGFIADYLEAMLSIRETAKDSGIVICEALREGYFFDELYKTKNITREQANFYAIVIQAVWRGYIVRRKIGEWLKKKKKVEEEREIRRSLKIEELLAGLGITYTEAKRAAGVIQTAYKESKREKQAPGEIGEVWMGEIIPFGQRLREGDRVEGRFDRWEKEDFGEFFEMDEDGAIKYIWPRVGQLRKILREEVPDDVPIVEFFAMRDLDGCEQYSYLIKSQPETESKGIPIGFLVPLPKSCVLEGSQEVEFTNPDKELKMGHYTYIYRGDVDKEELEKFEQVLKAQAKAGTNAEMLGEFDYDPHFVLPRVLVRVKKDLLQSTDDEVRFLSLPEGVVCGQDNYTFRAENLEQTRKVIRHILRNKCLSVDEGLAEAGNMKPYKLQETGRIFPVNQFSFPSYIQKLQITPESATAEEESLDLMRFAYIFVPPDYTPRKKLPKAESEFTISIIRFQGFHSEYKGSSQLDNKVFIMGPRINTPDGKPFTFESLFWEEFGIIAWHQLLRKIEETGEIEGEAEEERSGEILELLEEDEFGGKEISRLGETSGKIERYGSEAGESKAAAPEVMSQMASVPTLTEPTSEIQEEAEGEARQIIKNEEQSKQDHEEEPQLEPEDKIGVETKQEEI